MSVGTKAPRRTLDKQEAIRHLIHTAIRLIAKMEDPFAIHVLVHSADKLLMDIAKRRGQRLRLDWEAYVKPEYQKEFFARHRAAYNYFKHADKDFDAGLPVRDIMQINMMTLLVCATNYSTLFGEITNHMMFFMVFMMALYPDLIKPTAMERVELLKGMEDFGELTPREIFTTFLNKPNVLHKYTEEISNDLTDVVDFYNLSLTDLRAGKTKCDRIFRIPV